MNNIQSDLEKLQREVWQLAKDKLLRMQEKLDQINLEDLAVLSTIQTLSSTVSGHTGDISIMQSAISTLQSRPIGLSTTGLQLSQPGYINLTCGLIIQWGRYNPSSGNSWQYPQVNFPIEFSTDNSMSIVVTNDAGSGTNTVNGFVLSGSVTKSGFKAKVYGATHTNWIAIGY